MLALHAPFSPFFASPAVVAPAHFFGHRVTRGDDSPGLFSGHRCSVHIPQFVGPIFFEDDVDAIQEVSGAGADRLGVMLAFVHHLIVIDDGDLGVVLAGDIGIKKPELLDQVRSGLGDTESFALGITALAAVWDQSVPTTKVAVVGKTFHATAVAGVHCCTQLSYSQQGF
jgi:hypothetical protein